MRLLAAHLAALAFAAAAGGASRAAPAGELFVYAFDTAPGARAETDVDLSLPAPGIASVAEYLPAGSALDLSRRPGTAIGDATIFQAGRRDPDAGGLFTADPASFPADPCAPGVHAAVWTAPLDMSPLMIFVDPTAGEETTLGAYKLVYCLPADRRVIDVDLDLWVVLANPATAGIAIWRAFVTPAAGPAFELRSLVALPQVLTAEPAFATRTSVLTLGGRLVAAGRAHMSTSTSPSRRGPTWRTPASSASPARAPTEAIRCTRGSLDSALPST